MPRGGARPGAGRPRNIPNEDGINRHEFTKWQREQLAGNPNVAYVTEKTVSFRKEFKQLFWNRLNAGVHPVTIFTEAGIDPEVLGNVRVNSMAKELRKQVELGLEFRDGRDPSFPPGSKNNPKPEPIAEPEEKLAIPKPPRLPKRKDTLRQLYTDSEISDLIHNVAYMAQELEFIKKIILAGIGGKPK